jgi:hypothetical protein
MPIPTATRAALAGTVVATAAPPTINAARAIFPKRFIHSLLFRFFGSLSLLKK